MRRQLVSCLWARHSECTGAEVRGVGADHEVTASGGSESLSAANCGLNKSYRKVHRWIKQYSKSDDQVRIWQVKEKCLKTLSEHRERRCRGHVWWKTVPEGGARNRKSPFADGGEVERWCSKLVGEVDWSLCRDGTSATRVKYDDIYACALRFTAR